MPLLKNTNQPYFLDPNSPNTINCNGTFCYPISDGDDIYQQWYQTPCGNNLVIDPNFSNATYGADLITNGDFATDLSGWTTTGWIWNAGQAEAPALTTPNNLTQTIPAMAGILFWRVTFDVAGLAAGDEVRVSLGGGGYAVFDQIGSYDVIMRNTGTSIIFTVPVTNTANTLIDNVTLQQVTYSDWDTNDDWLINLDDGMACADELGTGLLIESVADYIVANDYYYLSFTVSDYVQGDVTPNVANVAGTAVSSNGVKEFWITPTATGVVSFLPSADFIGCISEVNLQVLRNDYLFLLVPDSGAEGEEYDFSEFMEYYQDKITLNSNIFSLLGVDYGCYTMYVTDMCLVEGAELIQNGTFAATDQYWTEWWGSHQYDYSAGQVTFIFEPLTGSNLLTNGDFSAGNAGWTFAGWTIGTGATHNTGNTTPLSRTDTIPYVVGLRTWIVITISGRTAGSFTVTLGNFTSDAYAENGTFCFRGGQSTGGVITYSINPTSTFDGTVDDMGIHQTTTIWDEGPIIQNPANSSIVAGNYEFSFDFVGSTGVIPVNAAQRYGVATWLFGQAEAFDFETTVATHTHSIANYVPGQQIPAVFPGFAGFDVAGGQRSYPGTITIDNVSLVRVEPFEATYTSECMNYQFEHINTKLVTGWCDQEAFGLDFANTGFKLQMRTEVRSLNPVYDKIKNIGRSGTGNSDVGYAAQAKIWTLATGYMSESAHDAMSAIIDCDHFTIGTSGDDDTEYIAEAEGYQPEWIKSGSYSLAPILINLRLKTNGMKFNRHI